MTKKLIVVDQREVLLYEDAVTAVRGSDGQIYVSLKHMCNALGLDDRSQRRRIQTHTILAEGYQRGDISTPPSEGGRGGGHQQAVLLRVDLVPLWLAGIETSKVVEAMRGKLENFQRGAAAVLWEAFQDGRLTGDPAFAELLQQDTPEVEAYKMIQGMLRLAQNQIVLRARLDDHEQRLESIEAQLTPPSRAITQSQAMQISQAVKAVAFAMGGKSENYQAVYGQMYREYEITGYKMLPATRFEDCMAWLTEWHLKLTGLDKLPF